jgi:Protein of unknown function (DUF3306)
MIADDDFVSRWSRRKIEARKAGEKPAEPKPSPEPASPADSKAGAAASPADAPVPRELPPVDSLQGLASEYKDFLRPGVDTKLRQAALKKLFHDPHFNVMDGLDTYIDDYSKPDPIPEAMLKSLKQANRMIFPEEAAEKDREIETETAKRAAADAGMVPAAEASLPEIAADDERVAPEPESPPAQDSKPPAKPA